MSISDKYEYLTFMWVYEMLGLEKIDKYFKNNSVKSYIDKYKNSNLNISSYFSFLSRGDFSRFNDSDKLKVDEYFKGGIDDILKNKENIYKFILDTYKLYYFNGDNGYKFYGGHDFRYMAPYDALVLGFVYIRFDDSLDKEEIICDKLNEIQEDSINKYGIKVSIIKYDEISYSRLGGVLYEE